MSLSARGAGPPGPFDDHEIGLRIAAFERQLDRLRAKRAWATYGLAGTIAVVFALQLLWGRGDAAARLPAMGSLIPARVWAGEAWRIASAAVLHASLQHAAFNALALVVLGDFIEKVLGGRRVLVLVLASAIGGNVASLLVHPSGQSVGASGGIWGLLGAAAVLGFRSGGVLHPALVPGVRRAAAINLALNIFVSFLPQVNMAAHLGGGITGALLVGTGVLTRGLPRYGPGDDFERPAVVPRWLGPAAAVLVATFTAASFTAVAVGRPWASPTDLFWGTVDLSRLGVRARVPVSLPQEDEPDEGGVRFVRFGNLRVDPLAVRIGAADRPEAMQGRALGEAGLEDLRRQLAEPPAGFTLDRSPETLADAPDPIVVARWTRAEDAVVFEIATRTTTHTDFVVYAAYRASDRDAFAGTAESIARSLVPPEGGVRSLP